VKIKVFFGAAEKYRSNKSYERNINIFKPFFVFFCFIEVLLALGRADGYNHRIPFVLTTKNIADINYSRGRK